MAKAKKKQDEAPPEESVSKPRVPSRAPIAKLSSSRVGAKKRAAQERRAARRG